MYSSVVVPAVQDGIVAGATQTTVPPLTQAADEMAGVPQEELEIADAEHQDQPENAGVSRDLEATSTIASARQEMYETLTRQRREFHEQLEELQRLLSVQMECTGRNALEEVIAAQILGVNKGGGKQMQFLVCKNQSLQLQQVICFCADHCMNASFDSAA
jgi:hypothetical protein